MRAKRIEDNQEITARYFIGGAEIGSQIRIGFGVVATIRKQYNNLQRGGVVGVELLIEDLIIEVKSSDTEQTCSLFNFGDRFYNIRGDGYTDDSAGVFLNYTIGITDPNTSPCRLNPIQRDPGPRLD